MMNGKKVLFVLRRAGMGGSCASMINLLSLYKEQGITFDVFLMDHTGEWTGEVAKYANLLPEDTALAAAIKPKSGLRGIGQYAHRAAFVLSHKLYGRNTAIQKVFRAAAKKLSYRYDHVIAYQESESTEFASYIAAPHKIAWVHTDFRWYWGFTQTPERLPNIYKQFRDIVCVTQKSKEAVIDMLHWPSEYVHVIKNTLPASMLCKKSSEVIEDVADINASWLFVSVGRLSPEKNFQCIPSVAKMLKEKGLSFMWYIIGDGVTKTQIESNIHTCNVDDCVRLLGAKMNPYPYIKKADCLVITSESEAQPMVANEALILDKPVISTEFTSVYEVIKDGENGMIVQQTPEAIADALEKFATDGEYREKLQNGAKEFFYSNEQELSALALLLS